MSDSQKASSLPRVASLAHCMCYSTFLLTVAIMTLLCIMYIAELKYY